MFLKRSLRYRQARTWSRSSVQSARHAGVTQPGGISTSFAKRYGPRFALLLGRTRHSFLGTRQRHPADLR